jgi:hypothetical protein
MVAPVAVAERPARDARALLGKRVVQPVQNSQTVGAHELLWYTTFLYEKLFLQNYEAISAVCRPIEEPGIVLVAIDPDRHGLAGALLVPARPDRPAAAVLGRHSECDLHLPQRETLSLRHLAILVEPARSFRAGPIDVAFRLVDLKTDQGFQDEVGHDLTNVRVEGTAFFRCGPFALFCLGVGDPTDWPDSAKDAWSFIPARVFLEAHGPVDHVDSHASPKHTPSMITRLPRPRALDELLAKDEPKVGELEIASGKERATLAIGEHALRDGVLIGRYDRCQVATARLDDASLSRVHLLIVRAGAGLVAVDTGSTAGTWVNGRRIGRLAQMGEVVALTLGAHTHLRWRAIP